MVAVLAIHDERELLRAWRDGDRKAGDLLMRSHARALRRFFANKLGKGAVVDELVQRTHVACVVGIPRFRGASSFRTWLFAVAYNVLREHFREQRREALSVADVELLDVTEHPETLLSASQEQRRLLAALRRISTDSRQLLDLYYWHERSAPELANALGIPVGTMRGRISKAKCELRRALDAVTPD